MSITRKKEVGVVVAHPDDESLWAGGTILLHHNWHCSVFSLCRASDPDRSPKFHRALEELGASGHMADLDDGPEQFPLDDEQVKQTIMTLIGKTEFDLILTHSPEGEYTRHLRHEETSRAVMDLWSADKIHTKELWLFAYNDRNRYNSPRVMRNAHLKCVLPKEIRKKKRHLIIKTYGFSPESWEANTILSVEAFWCFKTPREIHLWLCSRKVKKNEGITLI